jgi:hypothetical protein
VLHLGMARKREKLKHLSYDSPEYWEALLKEDGLSEKRGTTSKVVYVGTSQDLEIIEKYTAGELPDGKYHKKSKIE